MWINVPQLLNLKPLLQTPLPRWRGAFVFYAIIVSRDRSPGVETRWLVDVRPLKGRFRGTPLEGFLLLAIGLYSSTIYYGFRRGQQECCPYGKIMCRDTIHRVRLIRVNFLNNSAFLLFSVSSAVQFLFL